MSPPAPSLCPCGSGQRQGRPSHAAACGALLLGLAGVGEVGLVMGWPKRRIPLPAWQVLVSGAGHGGAGGCRGPERCAGAGGGRHRARSFLRNEPLVLVGGAGHGQLEGHGGDQGGAGGVGHGPGRSRAVIEVVRVVLGMGPEVADQGLAVLNSGPC